MTLRSRDAGLLLLDELVVEGMSHFTFAEAVERSGRSPTSCANLLHRLQRDGLLDRVRRGHYAIRHLGTLGTNAGTESVLLAVAAGFAGTPHRIAYRTALEELDLIPHHGRAIQVAVARPIRATILSGRPLTVILEPLASLLIGTGPTEGTFVADRERALLDAAARPELVGGAAVIAEAIAAAGTIDPDRLIDHARRLRWGPALRRIGSIADGLGLHGLAGKLTPLAPPTSDIALEPGTPGCVWRDSRWWVRWAHERTDLLNVVQQ